MISGQFLAIYNEDARIWTFEYGAQKKTNRPAQSQCLFLCASHSADQLENLIVREQNVVSIFIEYCVLLCVRSISNSNRFVAKVTDTDFRREKQQLESLIKFSHVSH